MDHRHGHHFNVGSDRGAVPDGSGMCLITVFRQQGEFRW